MPEADPRSVVWSATGWDGEKSLMSADLHFDRIERHAARLGIDVPKDLPDRVFDLLFEIDKPGDPNTSDDQAAYLVAIGVRSDGEVFADPMVLQEWTDSTLNAISLAAPIWDLDVRGTKHGDWGPHREAREIAVEHGAHIALLFEEDILVDGDRCAPLLLDHDGVAFHPRHADGALDSITIEQIRPHLESAGIPVRPARLTLSMILRASEMVVCGSGMGIRAVGTIDGRSIGTPRGRLFRACQEAWLDRLDNAWSSR